MKNILIIGGGLAALYFATQGKKGGVSSTAENFNGNENTNSNNGKPLAPAAGGAGAVIQPKESPEAQNDKMFDVELVGVSPESGYRDLSIGKNRNYDLLAQFKITNRSGKKLKVKTFRMNTPLVLRSFQRIYDVKLDTPFDPGESRTVAEKKSLKAYTGHVLDDEAKALSLEEILETIEFEVTI